MAEEIARLKAEPGGEILAHGGVRFVQSLVRLDLVDEYRLYVYPVAVGSGARLFPDLGRPRGCGYCPAAFSSVVCWRSHTGL